MPSPGKVVPHSMERDLEIGGREVRVDDLAGACEDCESESGEQHYYI